MENNVKKPETPFSYRKNDNNKHDITLKTFVCV